MVINPASALRVSHHRSRSLQHQDGSELSGQSLRCALAVAFNPRNLDPGQSRGLQRMRGKNSAVRYQLAQLGIAGTDIEGIGVEHQAPPGSLGDFEQLAKQVSGSRALAQSRPADHGLRGI